MRQFFRTLAVVGGSCILASGVQAGPFSRSTTVAPAPSRYVAAPIPQAQTPPPPLAAPVATPVPTSAPQPVAPRTLPNNATQIVEAAPGTAAPPRFCMVNNKLVLLSYEFTDVGPSGVSGVEVWYTRDGRGWQKFDGVQRENPVWVELAEGTFGIFLLARTGFGGGREQPGEGDQPHLWIQVDLTKPVVFLTGTQLSNGTRTLDISWTARDDNFGRKPINLSYAEQTNGPWMPIALGLENTQSYTWQIPPSTPASFFVRVEAVDQAGNMDSSISSKPVQIDLAQPGVANIQLKPLPQK